MKENELPEKGNTGVEKPVYKSELIESLLEQIPEIELLRKANAMLKDALESEDKQNAKLRQSLSELIPIAEKFISSNYSHPDRVPEQYKSAIDRAKLFRDGQQDKD